MYGGRAVCSFNSGAVFFISRSAFDAYKINRTTIAYQEITLLFSYNVAHQSEMVGRTAFEHNVLGRGIKNVCKRSVDDE